MKDQNYGKPAFGEPRYDRSANEMFDRVGSQLELVLEDGGIKAYPVDASATTPEDERVADEDRRADDPHGVVRPFFTRSIERITFSEHRPAHGPARRASWVSPSSAKLIMRSMFISEPKQPANADDSGPDRPPTHATRFPEKRVRVKIDAVLVRPTGPSKAPPPPPRLCGEFDITDSAPRARGLETSICAAAPAERVHKTQPRLVIEDDVQFTAASNRA